MAEFSMRIIDADYYLEKPLPGMDTCLSDFRQREIYKVPTIRIFGSTPRGQKCCLHIHGVFPYLYVVVPDEVNDVILFSKQFAISLDFALQVGLGRAVSKQQVYVNLVEVVRRKPLYGYCQDEMDFLKIYLYNPGMVKKTSEILINGAVLNQVFQPYETHIPYMLQFFIDYNLHGMNLIHLKRVQFRLPLPKDNTIGKNNISLGSPNHSSLGPPVISQTNYDLFNDGTVPSSLILSPDICKQTRCILEADAVDMDILNQLCIKDVLGGNPGLKDIWDDEKHRRRENQESSAIEVPQSQLREQYNLTENEEYQLQLMRTVVHEKIDQMGLASSSNNSENPLLAEGIIHESVNQTCSSDALSSSLDQHLVEILAGLDDEEVSNTPLSNTTLLNNGLSDEENNTEDDDDIESMLMTQQIHCIDDKDCDQVEEELQHSQSNVSECRDIHKSWTETFLDHIPQLDGSGIVDNPLNESIQKHSSRSKLRFNFKSINNFKQTFMSISKESNSKINLIDVLPTHTIYKPLRHNPSSCTYDSSKNKNGKKIIPQIDGNSYIFGSDSDDDFKPTTKGTSRAFLQKKARLSLVSDNIDIKSSGIDETEKIKANISRISSPVYDSDSDDGFPHKAKGIKCASHSRMKRKTKRKTFPNRLNYNYKTHSTRSRLAINDFGSLKAIACRCSNERNKSYKRKIKNKCFSSNKNFNTDIDRFNLKSFKIILKDVLNKNCKIEGKPSTSVFSSMNFYEEKSIDFCRNPVEYKQIIDMSSLNDTFYCDTLNVLSFPSPHKSKNDYDLRSLSHVLPSQSDKDVTDVLTHVSSIHESPLEGTNTTIKKRYTSTLDKLKAWEDSLRSSSESYVGNTFVIKDDQEIRIDDSQLYEKGRNENQLYGASSFINKNIDLNISYFADEEKMETNVKTGGSLIFSPIRTVNVVHKNIVNTHQEDTLDHLEICPVKIPRDTHSCVEHFEVEYNNSCTITPMVKPPSMHSILESLEQHNLLEVRNIQPYYSNEDDVSSKTGVYHKQHVADVHSQVSQLPKCILSTASDGALEDLKQRRVNNLDMAAVEQIDFDIMSCPGSSKFQNVLYGSKHAIITPCKLPPFLSLSSKMFGQNERKTNALEEILVNVKTSQCHVEKNIDAMEKSDKFSSFTTQVGEYGLEFPLNDLEKYTLEESVVKPFLRCTKTTHDSIANIQVELKSSNDSEIEGTTPDNTYGFDITHNFNEAKNLHVNQHLTVVSIELHIITRRMLKPDPTMDAISAIFYYLYKDASHEDKNSIQETGIFVVDSEYSTDNESNFDKNIRRSLLSKTGFSSYIVHSYLNEEQMILNFTSFIQNIDPDIIMGYEVQMLSWGYLIERSAVLDINICQMLSRVLNKENQVNVKDDAETELDVGTLVNMSICGRIVLNIWRIMRSEVTLQVYSFENVSYHVLHQRIPAYSFRDLSDWWSSDHQRWRVCNHYIYRCQGNLKMLDQIDFINRTSELARLFGILYYAVISRGSQFRVESMMLRIAKPLNFVPVSPSVHQRAMMLAPECIPLVIEPESSFYVDPVIVLDFQSLYPSIIIAYNYCYSTCLGKVQSFSLNEHYKFGATNMNLPLSVLKKLMKKDIHISPNGVGFVTSNVTKGVLPRMLEEILNTRIMVKGSMKLTKDDKVLYKMLDSRQLGLKLIANVTYGYTSAGYSGRMPCIEIGDSVVRKARETLERAIDLVHSTKKWNAKVVYGDTDSMFVLLKGASKKQAFAVAKEIVDEVTALNPKPVKLKFEKVYHPCVMITKKRYAGYKYDTLTQKEPTFDAKGIETVRRDNCPAVGKILQKSIRILFEKKDVSLVKSYVQKQFVKIMEEKVILKDYIFAKEYRGMNRYKPGACVPALSLTRKMLEQDRRSEPRIGERVPYVIVYGSPGLPLIKLVRMPLEVINNNSLRLNGVYYIMKQVCPALCRIFNLFGVDVFKWFTDLPKISRIQDCGYEQPGNSKGMISQYFTSKHCSVCEQLTNQHVCATCRNTPQDTAVILSLRIRASERRRIHLTQICQHCSGTREKDNCCISLQCPVFYKLSNVIKDLQKHDLLRNLTQEL